MSSVSKPRVRHNRHKQGLNLTLEKLSADFRYFYELAPVANRDVFDEMIARYGDYFVKATNMQGPLAMYDTFLYKYVIMKMYDDTKDQLEWQAVPTIN